MQTQPFEEGLTTLIQISGQERTAMMCTEAVPWRCHRSLVADALSVRGIRVVEILSEASYRMHKLTPFAQVEGMRITYPPVQATLPCSQPTRSTHQEPRNAARTFYYLTLAKGKGRS